MVALARSAKKIEDITNHTHFIIDASGSMGVHVETLIEVTDNIVKHLADKAKDSDQEWRISIWIFSDRGQTQCVVWDKDVLRMPSIRKHYTLGGMTALAEAALVSFDDSRTVSERHGNHSFLFYFVTDGEENNSLVSSRNELAQEMRGLPDNWTVAALVPNAKGVSEAKKIGFPAGNIQIWDTTTTEGLETAGKSILRSLDTYSDSRSTFSTTGFKSTTSLFDMSATAVNAATIQAAGLIPLDTKEYILQKVVFKKPFREGDDWISTYTADVLGHQFVAGRGYYQLTLAPVKVQINKDIAIFEKNSGRIYTGKNARALLGLPDKAVTLKAGQNPDYDIFIQSTSTNRKLLVGQWYLYLTPQVTYVKGQTGPVASPANAAPKVARMPLAPATVARRAAAAKNSYTATAKAKLDLYAPVRPHGNKALWANVNCLECSAKATQRCKKADGSPQEKPHTSRKV